MKRKLLFILTLLCLTVQGTRAEAWVKTEEQLTKAIADGQTNISLDADIELSKYLDIDGVTLTIDLNGYKLSRSLSEHGSDGHVIWAHGGCNLTLKSSVAGGSIEGGMANNGGAIHIQHGNTVSATNVIFQNNSAADHAGAIWNNGTFTATNCRFENNTASDVGGIYNSVTDEGAGTATLTGCSFTGNAGNTGAGALANALGATVMTIDGGTIKNNTADTYGAGIWNGGTLNMKGAITVQDNTNAGGIVSDVFLKSGKVITVTGSLEGSKIGIDMENVTGTFTSGFSNYDHGSYSPFTVDHSSFLELGYELGGEASLSSRASNPVSYIERSWDATNKKVVSTEKALASLIAYADTPREGWGQYKEVTNAPEDTPNEWFEMGGYSTSVPEFYVVRGNVSRETIVVQGKDVHLVLCNGATLTLTGGLKLEGDNKLYLHSQSYGGHMGRLIVTNKYDNAAGIGSALNNGKVMVVGELVIHGGHIEATGGKNGAGIGSCQRAQSGDSPLCKSVIVYGGYVKATGRTGSAGIGGGAASITDGVDGGQFVLYDGTVIAQGGADASGVGGGDYGDGGSVTVYGGSLTATGGDNGAGIGSGTYNRDKNIERLTGGTFTIYGGMVTANGGDCGAGIGGGYFGGGAEVNIYGGTVTATGGNCGSAIGGGYCSIGGTVTITGGTVTANGGEWASGIGGGYQNDGGDVTITGGTVIAKSGYQGGEGNRAIGPGSRCDNYGTLTIGDVMMVGAGNNGSVERIMDADERVTACWYRSYAEITPCTHPEATYTVSGNDANGTHTTHCSHCTTSFEAESHNFVNGECTVCHFKLEGLTTGINGQRESVKGQRDDWFTIDGQKLNGKPNTKGVYIHNGRAVVL